MKSYACGTCGKPEDGQWNQRCHCDEELIDRLVQRVYAAMRVVRKEPVEDFITVRSDGSAHFDLAAYLLTEEGRRRIDNLKAAKGCQ